MRKANAVFRNSEGLTAIELVVFIGMSAALWAIGNMIYTDSVLRSRSAEAKIELSSFYTAEKNFAAANGSFTKCIADIGYSPESTTRWFAIGFNEDAGSQITCGPQGNQSCSRPNWTTENSVCTHHPKMENGINYAYPANASMPDAVVSPPTHIELSRVGSILISKDSFTMGAISNSPRTLASRWEENGSLESEAHAAVPGGCDAKYSAWTIDQNRNLISIDPCSLERPLN